MKTQTFKILTYGAALLCFISCKKDWLEKKPDIALVVPSSLNDFQALLDNTSGQSLAFNTNNCGLGEAGADNYYLTPNSFASLPVNSRNAYTWNLNEYETNTAPDWVGPYGQIYITNVVLEGLKKVNINSSNQDQYNNIKGSALFYRSFAYYDMAQIFSKPFFINSANTDLGLPLRVSPNINNIQVRASVAETYSLILNDLKTSVGLLPVTPKYKTRPSKVAAFGLLARTYLSMADYVNAYVNADSCLKLYNKLIPFNTYNLALATPIAKYGDEVIFANNCTSSAFVSTIAVIDSTLYNSYDNNDLRKAVFFKKDASGLPRLFGRYSGSSSQLFDGLAVDEILLIRAEAASRIGNSTTALADLNTLLTTRWKLGTYVSLKNIAEDELLSLILAERRKELCFRGLRWSDLRRFNNEPNGAITLTRKLGGNTYTLKPKDYKYVYQIPAVETNFNTAIVQNPK